MDKPMVNVFYHDELGVDLCHTGPDMMESVKWAFRQSTGDCNPLTFLLYDGFGVFLAEIYRDEHASDILHTTLSDCKMFSTRVRSVFVEGKERTELVDVDFDGKPISTAILI